MVTFLNEKIRYIIQIITKFKVNVQGVVPNFKQRLPNFIFTQYLQVTDPMHHASKNNRRRLYQYNTIQYNTVHYNTNFDIYPALKQHGYT